MVNLYQKVKLQDGRDAIIVEVLGRGDAYVADVELATGDYETLTIYPTDIISVFVEVEEPFVAVAA
jgi:hypothetical protein